MDKGGKVVEDPGLSDLDSTEGVLSAVPVEVLVYGAVGEPSRVASSEGFASESQAMPSRPSVSASHGVATQESSLGAPTPLVSDTECLRLCDSLFEASLAAVEAHGVPYLESVVARIGLLRGWAQSRVRRKVQSLARIERRIARLKASLNSDETESC